MMAITHGRLALQFRASVLDGRTRLNVLDQQPPLKVVRAFEQPDGAALVHLHNVSGGVLAGDQLETHVHVGRAARAQITSTGATRIYRRGEQGDESAQRTCVQVEPGGLIEYVPDMVIPFMGSRYFQDTRIDLDEGAGLFWWEVIAPGREAHGELFAYERLEMKLAIHACGTPVVAEHIRLEPRLRALATPLRMQHYNYYATFYMLRVGCDVAALEACLYDIMERLAPRSEASWGVSALPVHGVAVRGLGQTGQALLRGLNALWHAGKQVLYGRAPCLPRKLY